MNEEIKQAAIDAINANEFLFLIAGTQNEDGSYDTQRVIEGKISELAFPIAEALKDNPNLANYIAKIQIGADLSKTLRKLARVFSNDSSIRKGKSKNKKGKNKHD